MDWRHWASIGGAVVVGVALMGAIVWYGSPEPRGTEATQRGEAAVTEPLPDVTFVTEAPTEASSPVVTVESRAAEAPAGPTADVPAGDARLPLDPAEEQRLYDRAVALYEAGEHEAASSLLDRVLTARRAKDVATTALADAAEARGFDAAVRLYALLSRAAADLDRAEALTLGDRYREAHDAVIAAGNALDAAAELDVPAHLTADASRIAAHHKRLDRVAWFVGITFEMHELMRAERYADAWRLYNFAKLSRDVSGNLTREQHNKLAELGRRIQDGMSKQSVLET